MCGGKSKATESDTLAIVALRYLADYLFYRNFNDKPMTQNT